MVGCRKDVHELSEMVSKDVCTNVAELVQDNGEVVKAYDLARVRRLEVTSDRDQLARHVVFSLLANRTSLPVLSHLCNRDTMTSEHEVQLVIGTFDAQVACSRLVSII
jgi:hypothetical protein